jgi:hypothetical protein
MALQIPFSFVLSCFRELRNGARKAAYLAAALSLALWSAVVASAQNPQPQSVYVSVPVPGATSEVAGFSKDGGSGALVPFSSPPLSDAFQGGPMAIDGLGQFLFVVNSDSGDISMFQIQSDGTLAEVPGSPFPSVLTGPVCLATEKSGQFLYVGYSSGNPPGHGTIAEFQILNQQILPIPGQATTDIPFTPVGLLTNPKGAHLYVGLDALGNQSDGTSVYTIESSGQLTLVPNGGIQNRNERSIAIDPQGRFFFDAWGSDEGFVESALISPASDTTTTPIGQPMSLGVGNFPTAMLVDGSGKFLYVQLFTGVVVYSIGANGVLAGIQAPTSTLMFQRGSAAADPQGPYIYSLQHNGLHAFVVDPEFGQLFEVAGSPFSVAPGEGVGGLAVSGSPVQAASGPAASLFPASQSFDATTVGQSSTSQTINLTNTGGEPLTVNSVKVSGTSAADFIATSTCAAVLPPNNGPSGTCAVSVTFTPTAAGLRQATLTANDTAGAQSAQLSGIGVAPQPAVTLIPGSLSFSSTAQGATSPSQSVTVTSSGAAPLHISSVLIGGANPADFATTSICTGAFPVGASCTMGVTFSPQGDGQREATLLIADDAPGSAQSVELSGVGIGPPVTRPGVTVAPSTVSFPATAVGTTAVSQTVTVASTGTAPVRISSIILGGANPNDFSMTDTCTPPATYAVHANCVLNLVFTPSVAGTRTASITITDDAPNSPQTVSVTGTANPLLVVGALAGGGLTATVSPGQTASYNLQLMPGFNGSVTIGCSGAPTAATCSVPPSMKVASGVSAPFSVTVTTTGAGALGPFSNTPRFMPLILLRLAASLVFCVMLLRACTLLRKTQWTAGSGRLICTSVLAGLVAAMFVAAGCGGGTTIAQSGPVPQPTTTATPQGTYTITLTPTATAASGSPLAAVSPTQLTLIVN